MVEEVITAHPGGAPVDASGLVSESHDEKRVCLWDELEAKLRAALPPVDDADREYKS